jgi:hypothetical protein
MRLIFRYTEAIQKLLGSKVKPEPWLHIAVKTLSKRNPMCGYVIYVWDTRKELASGKVSDDVTIKCIKTGANARDNHKDIDGHSKGAEAANTWFYWDRKTDAELKHAEDICHMSIDDIKHFPNGNYVRGNVPVEVNEQRSSGGYSSAVSWTMSYRTPTGKQVTVQIGDADSLYNEGELAISKAKAIVNGKLKLAK